MTTETIRPAATAAGRFHLSRATPGSPRGLRTAMLALAAAATLAGCAPRAQAPAAPAPTPAPTAEPAPPHRPVTIGQAARAAERAADRRAAEDRARKAADTPASRNMASYYAGIQDALKARGKMRTDTGSMAGITPETLTEHFILIALRDEYLRRGDSLVARTHSAPLRRWADPVRVQLVFGDSSGPAARKAHSAEIADFARRLSAASRHSVTVSEKPGNFVAMILSEDERRDIGPRLRELVPGIPAADVAAISDLAPQNYCTVFAYSQGGDSTYIRAVALLRAELPAELFTSCVHEELAQGLGLSNDSPRVRPSIFNDDEEYARLTQYDELLLRILYDPRLRPGMTEDEARPIVRTIAAELLGVAS